MKTLKYISILAVIVAVSLFMIECMEDEAVFVSPEDVTERVDIVLETGDKEFVYLNSLEGDASSDLVSFNFYGNNADRIDFKVDLGEGRTLVLNLVNADLGTPWEHEMKYSLYPPQVIDDKLYYVQAEMLSGKEVAEYSSSGEDFPRTTYVNVFEVVSFDPAASEIHCRLKDFPMESNYTGEEMVVNGTFRGSITFLN